MAEQGHKAPVIIKRVKKVAGGAHGGSWKVAYADFVTAMMAFFLLMWLLNMVPTQKQEQLAKYFQEFSIFEGGAAGVPLESGGMGQAAPVVGVQAVRPDSPAEEVGETPEAGQGLGKGEAGEAGKGAGKKIEAQLEQAIAEKLPNLEGQVKVSRDEEGKVRVEIMDKLDKPVFQSGGTQLTPEAKKIIQTLTEVIRKDNLKVGVEGHTDAAPYASGTYSNWDLSTERALAARKFMVDNGLPPGNVTQVAGYAATRLYDPKNPGDPKNRRISLLLYQEPGAGPLAQSAKPVGPKAQTPPPQAGQAPQAGQTPGQAQVSGEGAVRAPITPLERSEQRQGESQKLLEQQIDNIYDKATDESL